MTSYSTKQAWARGGLVFAATLMLIIGVYQIFVGIAAIVQDNFFVVTPNYAYDVDTTAWGWIHLGIGIVVALAGFYLFTGATAAKIIGIALLSLSAIANFFFLPYYPLWSLLIIGLDIFAIWAIASVRTDRDVMAAAGDQYGAGYTPGMGTGTQGGMQTGERWPQENPPAGRHLAPDDVKAGQGQSAQQMAEQQQQWASTGGRGGTPPAGNQPPMGNPPPPPPPRP